MTSALVQFAVASDSVQIQFKNITADFVDEHQIRSHVTVAERLEFSAKLMVAVFLVKFFSTRKFQDHFPRFLPLLSSERGFRSRLKLADGMILYLISSAMTTILQIVRPQNHKF